jgi:transcriptional regulator with XRE-family HTH domain
MYSLDTRLAALREALRLEWGQLAERLGVSRAMLDFMRKGQRNPSFRTLERIEAAEHAAGLTTAPPSRLVVAESAPEYRPIVKPKHLNMAELRREVVELRRRLDRLASMLEDVSEEDAG